MEKIGKNFTNGTNMVETLKIKFLHKYEVSYNTIVLTKFIFNVTLYVKEFNWYGY